MSTQTPQPGFFGALFDFSFSNFITSKLIPVLYVLGIALCGLVSISVLLNGLSMGGVFALLSLLMVPAVFLLTVMYLRVMLEVMIVLFRIAEDVNTIAKPSSV